MDRYVISVDGPMADEALSAFPDFKATQPAPHTVLQGELPDQAALAEVLDRLDELGVVILEVLTLPARPVEPIR